MYVGIQPRNVITCGSHIDHASLNEDVENFEWGEDSLCYGLQ